MLVLISRNVWYIQEHTQGGLLGCSSPTNPSNTEIKKKNCGFDDIKRST